MFIVYSDIFRLTWVIFRLELYLEIKCQLDATEVFIANLIACSTCFGHHYAHHQELNKCHLWYCNWLDAFIGSMYIWTGSRFFVIYSYHVACSWISSQVVNVPLVGPVVFSFPLDLWFSRERNQLHRTNQEHINNLWTHPVAGHMIYYK